MIKNYIKMAFRHIQNYKVFSFINIAGLAVGVVVVIFLFLFIDYELGFDSHVQNRDRIYRVVIQHKTPTGLDYSNATYFPLSQALRNDFPELPVVTQTNRLVDQMIEVDKHKFDVSLILFVEPDFYNLIQPQWIAEDVNRGSDPTSVILTESMSKKLFGNMNSIGRRFTIGKKQVEVTVTGIVADPPAQTSIPYEMLISWGAMKSFYSVDLLSRWNYSNRESQTFLKLPQSKSSSDFEVWLDKFKLKYLDKEDFETVSFHLQPFSEIHFDDRYGSYSYVTSFRTLWTFGAIGLLVLIIACINFINLTTARAMKRTREIAMRKVLGADRKMVIGQLLGETGVFILIALLLGLTASILYLPQITAHLGVTMETSRIFSSDFFIFFGGLFLFLLLINGIYPALVLSRFKPIEAMKSNIFSKGRNSISLRNGLVLIQFAVSQILIVLTLIIAAQSNYILKKDLGFVKDNIIIVECPAYDETVCESLRSRWMQNPQIQDVSFAYQPPSSESNIISTLQYSESGNNSEYTIAMKPCDSHYLDVYKIPLLAGSFYKNNIGSSSNPQWVVNEDVLKKIGFASPEEAIGKQIKINGQIAPVIGVVGDFHISSLREKLQPVVLINTWSRSNKFANIRISGADISGARKSIRDIWQKTYPGEIFKYSFLDEELQSYYAADARTFKLTQISTFLAIALGCLGLLGLVSFVLAQKDKEIAIRKVLGVSIKGLYIHIVKQFIVWVLVANLISWPVSWYLSREWLNGFSFRIELGIGVFILGSSIVLVVALLVISFQVLKAANANPINALKNE